MHTLGNAGKQFSRGFSGKSKAQYFFGHNMVFIDQFDNAVGHHTGLAGPCPCHNKDIPVSRCLPYPLLLILRSLHISGL